MLGRRTETLLVAVLAAGLLGAGACVWAQAPNRSMQRSAGPGDRSPMMHGMERLYRKLNLNPQQEDLWKKAWTAQREAFHDLRAKRAEMRAELRVEIDKPGVNLKQLALFGDRLRERMHAEAEATRKRVREDWFAVYDALDAGQKEQVRVAIRDRMDRPGGMMSRHRHYGAPRGKPGGEQGMSCAGSPDCASPDVRTLKGSVYLSGTGVRLV